MNETDEFCELVRVAVDSLMRAKIAAEQGAGHLPPVYMTRVANIQQLSAGLESWFERDRRAPQKGD